MFGLKSMCASCHWHIKYEDIFSWYLWDLHLRLKSTSIQHGGNIIQGPKWANHGGRETKCAYPQEEAKRNPVLPSLK